MGQLRKRGNVWWIRYHPNGNRFETRALARQWAETERMVMTRGDTTP